MMIETLKFKSFSHFLKPRPKDAHKGSCGHVLIIGGAEGFSGSVILAGLAAYRVGAGLVSVAMLNNTIANYPLEIMCHKIKILKDLSSLISKATVIVMGPGMAQSRLANTVFTHIVKSKKPLILDADALAFLAKKSLKNKDWILTPHPGEAARLLQIKTADIQSDRKSAIYKIQKKWGGICILKGAGTLILGPEEPIQLCEAGNPGMATAGMGDVLSGILGGLAAQGIPLMATASLGVLLHALAADRAASDGERGMIASDLFPHLRRLVNP